MIGDPARLVIRRPGARPAAAVAAPFGARSTSFIVDALQGRGALDHRIKPLDPTSRFAGFALTARAGARDNLAAVAALDLIEPGDVLVIAAQGFAETAVLGDNMARIARMRGAVAVVTDGAVRDVDEIRATGLPVSRARSRRIPPIPAGRARSACRWCSATVRSRPATSWPATPTAWSSCRRHASPRS